MCLAIVNTSGLIAIDVFANAAYGNPHGMGLLFTDGRNVIAHKEMHDVKDFYFAYKEVRAATDKPILLHWRFATQGSRDLANCHPFLIDTEHGFIHNGILDGLPYDKDYSDTYLFNELCLKKVFSPEWAGCTPYDDQAVFERLVEEYLGGSKLCFLRADGEVRIVNEHLGFWLEGSWYSNYSGFNYLGYSTFPSGEYVDEFEEFSRFGLSEEEEWAEYWGQSTYGVRADLHLRPEPREKLSRREKKRRRREGRGGDGDSAYVVQEGKGRREGYALAELLYYQKRGLETETDWWREHPEHGFIENADTGNCYLWNPDTQSWWQVGSYTDAVQLAEWYRDYEGAQKEATSPCSL